MITSATKFKETNIGLIPEEWDVIKLGDVVEKIVDNRGKTPPITDFGHELIETFQISIEEKYPNLADKEKQKYVSEETYNSWFRAGHPKKDDILFSTVGASIPQWCFIPDDSKYCIAQNLIALRPNKKLINSEFLRSYFNTPLFKSQVNGIVITTAQPSIKVPHLLSLEIALPPLEEQVKLGGVISSIEDKIELNRKINANLSNLTSSMFKKWFVDIGDELPEGWRIGTFGEAIENFDSRRIPLSSMEREKRRGQYPYYGATSIVDYVDDYIFDGSYVLLGEDGSVAKEDGKPFVQYVSGKIWVNNHAHVLRGKNGFSTEYIKVFLDQVDIFPFVTGAVQPKLNQANMNSISMLIPDKKTLDLFNETLTSFFMMILDNENQIKNLSDIRDSLLPRLMSGKIRVK